MGEPTDSTVGRPATGRPERRRPSAPTPFARVRDSEGRGAAYPPDTDAGRRLLHAAAELIAVAGRG